MIPNALIVVVGLWLSWLAIFSTSAGGLSDWQLGLAGIVVAASAVAAWRRDIMGWQSWTNVVLGLGLAALAALRLVFALTPLALFWIILLAGVTVAIGALWSILYPREVASASSAETSGTAANPAKP